MSGEQQRISSAPTRADDKTNAKDFSALQKLFVVGIALSTMGGIWFFMSGQAATTFDVTLSPTTVAETITTNPTLETGLVGHWTFDGEDMDWSSTTAEVRDRTLSPKDLNWVNHANTVTPGVLGQAISFDGVDDYVRDTSGSTTDKLDFATSSSLSLSFWAYWDGTNLFGRAVANGHWVWRGGYAVEVYNGNWLGGVGSWNSTTSSSTYTYAGAAAANKWTHIALVVDKDAGKQYIYVDGIKAALTKFGGTCGTVVNVTELDISACTNLSAVSTVYPLTMGASPDLASRYWAGALDDVRVYNRALSAEEVKRLYGLGATTHVAETITTNPQLETGLVGHWTFDGDQMDWSSTTAEVRDRSGQGNHGNTDASMNANISTAPGVMGQGVQFDGVDDVVSISNGTFFDISQSFTTSLWILPDRYGDPTSACVTLRPTFLVYKKNLNQVSYRLFLFDNGMVRAGLHDGAANVYASTTLGTTVHTWRHVLVSYESGTGGLRLYVDGALVDAADASGVALSNHADPVVFAGEGPVSHCGSSNYQGALDDVRIYNRALSAQEIKRLYDLGR